MEMDSNFGCALKANRNLSSHIDMEISDRLISSISFAYSEAKGPYMSVYYHSSFVYPWPGARESKA